MASYWRDAGGPEPLDWGHCAEHAWHAAPYVEPRGQKWSGDLAWAAIG
jgi:hypothetical protein